MFELGGYALLCLEVVGVCDSVFSHHKFCYKTEIFRLYECCLKAVEWSASRTLQFIPVLKLQAAIICFAESLIQLTTVMDLMCVILLSRAKEQTRESDGGYASC